MIGRRLFIATAIGVAAYAVPAVAREPAPIRILTGGDDGLTQRLLDAIEERLRSSGRFAPSPVTSNSNVLRMTIPTHVQWEPVGNRTRVRYQLEFRRGETGEAFGFFEGTCWENELSVCARQALFAATSALEAN